ncbi:hypothetical protein M1P56_33540 [Streptomyces sp. HU2014]|uniref:hypothetical protein n=1 Tax=Streptomyces sp. HU2014 TaxID=2939414 RepID=UPI00200E1AA5|nr:hypothetical protein [Streptomyces sp. HU2014]UQI48889.1 hypothetical protein M1P56_33540 [Streptomyces sp. HU2014]
MAFDQEWAELKSAAKDPGAPGMRLDHVGTGQPGPDPALVVHQDDLGAVGHEAFRLHGLLSKKADIAGAGSGRSDSGSTARAARELSAHHLTMGDELYTTLSVWDSQVRTVLQMCAHISNHLDYSKKAHAQDDRTLAASMRHRDGSAVSASEISKYVK